MTVHQTMNAAVNVSLHNNKHMSVEWLAILLVGLINVRISSQQNVMKLLINNVWLFNKQNMQL